MSTTALEGSAPTRPCTGEARVWLGLVAGAFVVAGASLVLLPRGLGYDPWSWLVWGREIGHLALDTRHAATAVKPLPVAVDVLLAPAGSAAPVLWLLVARAAALLSLALAFRLGRRLGGPAAGAAAVVGLLLADQSAGHLFVAGMSEPMATGAVLAAADSLLRGRRRSTLVFLVAAGLLRPEAWPLLVLCCAWLAVTGRRRHWLLALLAVGVPAVWFAIDWFGARELSRSAEAASHQSQGGPLLSRVPGLATFTETWSLASGPVLVAFVVGLAGALLAWRRSGRPGPLVWLGATALGWVLVDAALAQLRLATGAPRYLLPADGLACVVAGCLVADVVRRLRSRRVSTLGWWLLGLALVGVCVPAAVRVGGQVGAAVDRGNAAQALQDRLPAAIAAAGGRGHVLRCGPVSVGPFDAPAVAWQLRVPVGSLRLARRAVTGTVLESGSPTVPHRAGFRLLAGGDDREDTWTVLSSCPPVSGGVSTGSTTSRPSAAAR